MMSNNVGIKVSLGRIERRVGILSLCFGILFFSLLFLPNIDRVISWIIAPFFMVFGLCLIVFSNGSIEITDEKIVMQSLFSKYELIWKNLREIYVNTYRGNIILISDECRLYVPQTASWIGKDKQQLYELLILKLESSKVEPIMTTKNVFRRSEYLKSK